MAGGPGTGPGTGPADPAAALTWKKEKKKKGRSEASERARQASRASYLARPGPFPLLISSSVLSPCLALLAPLFPCLSPSSLLLLHLACLPARPPAHLPVCLPACLPASLPPYLSCSLACPPSPPARSQLSLATRGHPRPAGLPGSCASCLKPALPALRHLKLACCVTPPDPSPLCWGCCRFACLFSPARTDLPRPHSASLLGRLVRTRWVRRWLRFRAPRPSPVRIVGWSRDQGCFEPRVEHISGAHLHLTNCSSIPRTSLAPLALACMQPWTTDEDNSAHLVLLAAWPAILGCTQQHQQQQLRR